MNTLNINISQHLTAQFVEQLSFDADTLVADPEIGEGYMKFVDLPGAIELYHFVEPNNKLGGTVRSVNPHNSEWYLIHINLGSLKQRKQVEGELVELHKYSPAGMLLYCPGIDIFTPFDKGSAMEFASIRFHRSFFSEYFSDNLIGPYRTFIYEDLDIESERWLRSAVNGIDSDKLSCHASVLKVLHRFCVKLNRHDKVQSKSQFHASDVRGLFEAASRLRNPRAEEIPSVPELASIAGMGTTKFKEAFCQMFGIPPGKYHIKVKMEYAREQMLAGKIQPVELSYMLGYSHPSNFTLAFKKYFGELPSEVYQLQP